MNALIGRALLPAGLTPLTSVTTTVRHGDDPHAQVRFLDGHEEKQPLSALRTLVTEPGNSGNRRGVADVTASRDPVEAPDGTLPPAAGPSGSRTVTASVGRPRESRISSADTSAIVKAIVLFPCLLPARGWLSRCCLPCIDHLGSPRGRDLSLGL